MGGLEEGWFWAKEEFGLRYEKILTKNPLADRKRDKRIRTRFIISFDTNIAVENHATDTAHRVTRTHRAPGPVPTIDLSKIIPIFDDDPACGICGPSL